MRKEFLNIIILVFFAIQFGCQDYKKVNLNPNFRKELVKALKLNLVTTDSIFRSSNMRIAHDTIFGYYNSLHKNSYDDISNDYFFIKSLIQTNKKYKINSDFHAPSSVDTMDNGKIYFPPFAGSHIVSLDTVGNVKTYFEKYQDTMFNANSLVLYKNRIGIRSMNGLYVFDLKEQKLLWKYKFSNVGTIYSKVILDKLIFKLVKSENLIKSKYDSIYCLDLDSANYSWKIGLKGEDFRGDIGAYSINSSKKSGKPEKRIYFSTDKRALVVNLENGKIIYANQRFRSIQPTNKQGYLLARKDDECFLLNEEYKVIWKVKNFVPVGFHGDYLIGTSLDKLNYFILETTTGKQIAKVLKNDPDDIELFMMGNNYILIDKIHLYN